MSRVPVRRPALGVVRAGEHNVERRTLSPQVRRNVRLGVLKLGPTKVTAADARSVGDQEHRQARAIRHPDQRARPRDRTHIIMPGIDGIELIQWVADQEHKAKIIVVSGGDASYIESARTLAQVKGLDSIETLTKPISLSDLRKALS